MKAFIWGPNSEVLLDAVLKLLLELQLQIHVQAVLPREVPRHSSDVRVRVQRDAVLRIAERNVNEDGGAPVPLPLLFIARLRSVLIHILCC